jgi:hypothetical protein
MPASARRLLAPLAAPVEHVTTLAAAGPGSLDAAVGAVDDGGTIAFDPALFGTIELGSPLFLTRAVTIEGPGAQPAPPGSVLLEHVTIAGNSATNGSGGGLSGVPSTLLVDSVLAGNSAPTGPNCAPVGAPGLAIDGTNVVDDTDGCGGCSRHAERLLPRPGPPIHEDMEHGSGARSRRLQRGGPERLPACLAPARVRAA